MLEYSFTTAEIFVKLNLPEHNEHGLLFSTVWIQRAREEHVAVAENINKVILVCKDKMKKKTNC